MNRKEAKTGQSVDTVKVNLINPALTESILAIPEIGREISFIDIGSGDATSSNGVINALVKAGSRIRNLALIDADIEIFPDLLGTVTTRPSYPYDTQVVQAKKRDILAEFFKHYEGQYDVALLQLVLHQIQSDQETTYLTYCAYRALKPTGNLLVVNLHPKYLQYLADNEPSKFEVTDGSSDRLVGNYHFDSGGSACVFSRSIESQLAMVLGLGFNLSKVTPLTPSPLVDQKARYRSLEERRIPMFYLMNLRKNPANFVSSTEGTVKTIEPSDSRWLKVVFADDDEIRIPAFRNWGGVATGSRLMLHEIYRKEIESTVLNYWIVDSDEKVTGGQIIARKQ